MSGFDDASLGVDNPQSREEDEELEEQRRRQAELADLLAAGIQEFNYDESTMNSSVTSAEGGDQNGHNSIISTKNVLKYNDTSKTSLNDTVEKKYKNADQNEQLKILYEVRMREIHKLRNEFEQYRDEKCKEINVLKNKVTLSEAEIRHLQVTLSNSESLLVEKTDIIKNLKETVHCQEQDLISLKKIVEQQKFEMCTYQSTLNELQMKLADNNPFSNVNRKMQSEELQKVHQDQIIKLESLLQEQSKKTQILEKEKSRLEEDVKKLIKEKNDIEEENNLTIMGLSKKLQNTQQQCKDLFVLGEAIKKESDHFKERLEQMESNRLDLSSDFQSNKMDRETMMVHLQKMKRMLLDKETEINTLKAQLKFYDSDLNELFEYRQLLSKMFSSEIKPCSNVEHEELIIFMRGQLQSYQQAVEDRNNQILNLNLVNKELQEKIEEMIQQTRTDIQNISQKYSLPQLETMSNELKNAEETINELKQQLLEKENQDIVKQLQNAYEENDKLQRMAAKEKHTFEKILVEVKQQIKKNEKEIEDYKKKESLLNEENERVKMQIQKICLKLGLSEADIFESDTDLHEIKAKYGSLHQQLQQVVAHLENSSPKKTNINFILKLKKQIQNYLNDGRKMEGEEFGQKLEEWNNLLSDFVESLKYDGNTDKDLELIEDLTTAKTMLEGEKFALEDQIKSLTIELEESRKDLENSRRLVQKLNDEVNNIKKCLKVTEDNKLDIEKQLDGAKQEIIDLHKEITMLNENTVRKKLSKELEDVENNLEDDKLNNLDKSFQAQILKAEISLRDRLQQENLEKMQKIEQQYRKVINEKTDLFSKEKEKWKLQEANYRKQFAVILEECGKKMQEIENENEVLKKRLQVLEQEYNILRTNAVTKIEQFSKIAIESKNAVGDLNKKWSQILDHYIIAATKIEKQHKQNSKNILKKIALNQTEMTLIERMYQEKMEKFKQQNPR